MITTDEVFDEAMKAALNIMAMPRGGDVVTRLERLYLEAYERGMSDAAASRMLEASMQIDIEEVLGRVQ